MAWTPEPNKVPTSVGRIDHFLDDLDGTNPNRSLRYHLDVLDQNGEQMKVLSGDEVPHLTQTQINNFLAFMANRRTNLPTNLSFPAGHLVGRCTWRFRDLDGTNPNRSLYARVVQLDAGGQFVQVHQFNDQPFLTAQQVTLAIAFLDAQRAKAAAEILP